MTLPTIPRWHKNIFTELKLSVDTDVPRQSRSYTRQTIIISLHTFIVPWKLSA
jgi:hypothetical protein